MSSLLRRYGFAIALVVAYLYSFPYFPEIKSANELPRVYLTQAMVEEHTFAIDTGVARWGGTADVSPSGAHHYSNKAPGSSFLAVPAYLALSAVKAVVGGGAPTLGEMTWTFRFFTGMVPTLLFLWLLWRFLARFAPDPTTRRLAIVGYALGSMAMTYSVLFISHQLSAICIGTAYILSVWVVEDDRDPRWLLAAGFAAGCAPLVDYQAVFAGLPIAVYLIANLLKRSARPWRGIAMAVAGSLPPMALLLFYHWKAFGHPLKTGYAASTTFAHFHQRGFLGMDKLRWEAFVGSTVAPDNGLIFLCPMLLLAIAGWWLMARAPAPGAPSGDRTGGAASGGRTIAPSPVSLRWHLGVTLGVAVIYLLFISSLNFWRGGWQMGPRYITAMLPFAMVPVTVALAAAERHWVARGVAVGLVAVGVVVYALSCAEYPHFPEKFHNPLYEVTFRLIGDGHAPYNAGWLLGLRGLASLLPYFAIVGGLLVWVALPRRDRWRSALLGAAVAGMVIAAYAAAPRGGPPADAAYQRWVAGVMPR